MKLTEICAALEITGIPVAYRSFKEKVIPPYVVYFETNSSPIAADLSMVARWGTYRAELYTDGKDLVAEGKIEGALDGIGAIYDKAEVYIADEQLLEIIYEFEGVET